MNSGAIAESYNRGYSFQEPVEVEEREIENLSIVNFTNNSISISWDNPTQIDDVESIDIYLNNVFHENTGTIVESWALTNLEESTYYSIILKAIDNNSNVLFESETVIQRTDGPTTNLNVPQYVTDAILVAQQDIPLKDPNDEFLKFIFITDTHYTDTPGIPVHTRANNPNSEKAATLLSQSGLYDFIVFGGDQHDANHCDKPTALKRISEAREILDQIPIDSYFIRGNHDVNYRALTDKEANRVENDEFYDAWNNNGSPKIVDPNNPKGNWFYRDFPSHNLRILLLNGCDNPIAEFGVSNEQKLFLENTMIDTTFDVFVFTHQFGVGSYPASVYKDFIRDKGGNVTVFAGHLHQDMFQNGSYGTKYIRTAAGLNLLQDEGTLDEICMDSIVIDTNQRKILMHRVGRGADRELDY